MNGAVSYFSTNHFNPLNSFRMSPSSQKIEIRSATIQEGKTTLSGRVCVSPSAKALIIVAGVDGVDGENIATNVEGFNQLHEASLSTLHINLLTNQEILGRENIFDIELLAHRLAMVTRWARLQSQFESLPIGYFGTHFAAAAALQATSLLGRLNNIYAVVSLGGRSDLAEETLGQIQVPVLFLVDEKDLTVKDVTRRAQQYLKDSQTLVYSEDQFTNQVAEWFLKHLPDVGDQTLLYFHSKFKDAIAETVIVH